MKARHRSVLPDSVPMTAWIGSVLLDGVVMSARIGSIAPNWVLTSASQLNKVLRRSGSARSRSLLNSCRRVVPCSSPTHREGAGSRRGCGPVYVEGSVSTEGIWAGKSIFTPKLTDSRSNFLDLMARSATPNS